MNLCTCLSFWQFRKWGRLSPISQNKKYMKLIHHKEMKSLAKSILIISHQLNPCNQIHSYNGHQINLCTQIHIYK